MRQVQWPLILIMHDMKVAQLLSLVWALVLGACSSPNMATSIPNTPQPESDDEAAEFVVYNALLKARFVHESVGMLVIRRNTSLGPARSSRERSDYFG